MSEYVYDSPFRLGAVEALGVVVADVGPARSAVKHLVLSAFEAGLELARIQSFKRRFFQAFPGVGGK